LNLQEDTMSTMPNRKTHPMVLTAAIAVTIFSILGSAAITGLIPSAHSGRAEFSPSLAEPSSDAGKPFGYEEKPFKSSISGKSPDKPARAVPDNEKPSIKPNSPGNDKTSSCKACGVIESIRTVDQEGDGTGLGAVAGGVAGGVLGNQVGKGKGNTLMTILGIGGGAYAGHTIEKNMKSSTAYIVKVRMDDGTYRTVTQHSQPEYAVGDHVRVASGHITST
jgi:outer membrane lipoprotein SlyB